MPSIFAGDVEYAPAKAILRGAEMPAGKNTVGSRWVSGKLKSHRQKSYELFWVQNAFSLKTVGPLEPFCSLLNCFYAVSNVNLCFCSHEILSPGFFRHIHTLGQCTDRLERLGIKYIYIYRNHLLQGRGLRKKLYSLIFHSKRCLLGKEEVFKFKNEFFAMTWRSIASTVYGKNIVEDYRSFMFFSM